MKKEKLLRAMSLADDKFVEEANPAPNIQKRKAAKRRLVIALAATLAVLTSLSLWLFIPLKDPNADITRYADSEYYDIIQKLHAVGYIAPRYKNNFEKYIKRAVDNFAPKKEYSIEDAGAGNPEYFYSSGTNASSNYQEVTDNQVEGVIEADLIKRTDTHIFFLDGTTLRAFSIAGEDSREVGSYEISANKGFVSYGVEFYLSLDGKSVTLVLPHPSASEPFVEIEQVDVSDPASMTSTRSFCVSGSLKSTRMTNGELLVLTNFYPKMDFSRPENFVPSISENGDDMKALPLDDLYVPNELTGTPYTVISRLDANTLEHKDTYSLLSYSSDVYVSADTIYTWRGMSESVGLENGVKKYTLKSEIVGVSYNGSSMNALGSVKVDGSIKDQYSLDQYGGILRVVTSIEESKYQTENYNGRTVASLLLDSTVNASLYCVDLSSWQVVASVEKFAPEGENVRSARFDGKNAYVCTAVQLQDPVFFFDLSDLGNITYTQTGTISGFSTSLVDFAKGYLLGIGVGADGYLKIEVYEEVDGKVVSVCKYEPPYTVYGNDYKSYYIDRENGLIGLGTSKNSNVAAQKGMLTQYTVLHFSDRALTEKIRVDLDGADPNAKRGVYVDGYFYMFGQNDFKVEKLDIGN